MNPLPTDLRNKLERTIVQARDVAEEGAKAALEALAVHHHEPYGHMLPEKRKLRNHLRARARQLGDKQNRKGELESTHLIWECAYEHWHRMLFARFLAENDLLIEPEMDVAISLGECEELAKEEGKDLWSLASEFAQHMLPQIFRPDGPLLKITFAREHRLKLEQLLDGLKSGVFTASDSLGWVYQFWQTKRKKEVNESGNKIGADELPAVTQLFTEPYMVSFLLDNSLGAWWAARRLTEADLQNAENEDELRSKASIPCVPLEYLRFVKVAEASSLCKKEIGYFHKDEPIANLSGDLPHWRQEGVTYFVTFRSNDSIPQGKLNQWKKEKEKWLASNPEPHDEKTKEAFYEQFPKRLQKWLDNGYGKCLLADRIYRDVVETALQYFDGERYHLDEFVVMPNHVHALITPTGEHKLSEILHSWKSFTANQINKISGNSGAFWQKESFDHIMRSPAQVERIRQYIKEHPAYSGRGFQPLEKQRQDAAATIWTPAAGTFDGWPEHLSELKILDPCCGSGHFLVAAFLMLVPMRMELEGLSAREAVDAVLRENLHGLEIDRRCVELAAFALAFAAWGYPDARGYRPLPELNVACSGLPISAKKEEWLALAGDNTNLRMVLEELYKQFKDAPVLGSLINPEISFAKDSLFEIRWEEVGPPLIKALSRDQDDEKTEMGVIAQSLAKAAEILSNKYELVATNVPYLARAKQSVPLSKFCDRNFSESKNDLANTFILRSINFCRDSGFVAAVTKQDWQYQDYEKKFRKRLLTQHSLNLLAWLGTRGFSTPMFDLNVVLIIASKIKAKSDHSFTGIDVSNFSEYEKKALALIELSTIRNKQKAQLNNPDARILLRAESSSDLLLKYTSYQQGICTGDLQRFGKKFWEIHDLSDEWEFQQSTVNANREYGGLENIIYWQNGGGKLFESISMRLGEERVGSWLRGIEAWGKKGIAVSSTGVITSSLYMGNLYDDSTMVLIPKKNDNMVTIWAFCGSDVYNKEVRKLDRKLKVRSALIKVPFDLEYWQKVAFEKYPDGLPKPYSDDPTQWIFHGHPTRVATASSRCDNQSQDGSATLQVAVARLLGYRWPAELDAGMELADEQREWVNKCDGLLKYVDEDGIVCIPSVRGEEPAAGRLLNLLSAAYESGRGFQPLENQRQDAAATLPATKDLDDWLRDHFFEQHCKLFHHRPFIWHIWDGRRRDGFHALVNYHKLAEGSGKGRQLLENLTYSYLGDWITRQKDGVRQGEGGAEDRLAAALELQKRLIAIIEGEPPFDIFVRWKPIEEQPIGWEPDINDGIRINIRPFMADDIPGGRKGAGILRWKPNIKWSKDRGKEPSRPKEQYPWFWKNGEFTGDRVNDIHLTNEEKRQARGKDKEG